MLIVSLVLLLSHLLVLLLTTTLDRFHCCFYCYITSHSKTMWIDAHFIICHYLVGQEFGHVSARRFFRRRLHSDLGPQWPSLWPLCIYTILPSSNSLVWVSLSHGIWLSWKGAPRLLKVYYWNWYRLISSAIYWQMEITRLAYVQEQGKLNPPLMDEAAWAYEERRKRWQPTLETVCCHCSPISDEELGEIRLTH